MDYEDRVEELENLIYKMAELIHSLDNNYCDLTPDNCDNDCIACISEFFEEGENYE